MFDAPGLSPKAATKLRPPLAVEGGHVDEAGVSQGLHNRTPQRKTRAYGGSPSSVPGYAVLSCAFRARSCPCHSRGCDLRRGSCCWLRLVIGHSVVFADSASEVSNRPNCACDVVGLGWRRVPGGP
jgi:hypothetical protein